MGSLNPFQTPKPAPIVVKEVVTEPPLPEPVEEAPTQQELDQEASKARPKAFLNGVVAV